MKKILYSICLVICQTYTIHSSFSQTSISPLQKIDSGAIWIDKFDNNNLTSLLGGNWFSYTDVPNQGTSFITPTDIKNCYTLAEDHYNDKVFKFNYTLQKGNYKWDPYVAVSVGLNKSQIKVSFKNIKGIAYDYQGTSHNFIYGISTVTDYAHYKKIIPTSKEWRTIVIPFEDLNQPGWGSKVPFEPNKVESLSWLVMGRDQQTGELQIDNIRLLTQLPEVTNIVTTEEEILEPKTRQIPSFIKIANWPGFTMAAYSLTFDDNLPSQLNHVLPVLNQYELKATFYVMTNSSSWEQFANLNNNGHEIGSHSCRHSSLIELSDGDENSEGSLQYELVAPIKSITTQLPSYKVTTFAYPYGIFNPHVSKEASKRYFASRGVWEGFNSTTPQDWMNLRINSFQYNSSRTLESDTNIVNGLKNRITQQLTSNGGWGIFLAHDVLPFKEAINVKNSWHPVSKESFESFVKWLKEKQEKNELWIETVANVTRYAKERDGADIQIISQGNSKLELQLSDDLPDDIFNYPLTMEISLPWSWKKVIFKQGNKNESLQVKDGKIIISAIPNGGIIEISKME